MIKTNRLEIRLNDDERSILDSLCERKGKNRTQMIVIALRTLNDADIKLDESIDQLPKAIESVRTQIRDVRTDREAVARTKEKHWQDDDPEFFGA